MRYAIFVHREYGAVADLFEGFVEAENDLDAMEKARDLWPSALTVTVRPHPHNPNVDAFWRSVLSSIGDYESGEILEAGKRAAETI